MKTNPIVVIGGGAAGAAAAARVKRLSPSSEVIILEKTSYISVGVCEFPYVISGEIADPASLIFYNAESFEKEKGVRVVYSADCKSIDAKNHTLEYVDVTSGNTIIQSYSKLILAPGSESVKLPGLRNDCTNVFNLKSYADLIKIQEFLKNRTPRNIVVFGAGYLGLEIADALTRKGISVIIIDKAERPLSGADSEFSMLVSKLLESKRVEFIGNNPDPVFFYEGDKVAKIKLNGGRVLECDGAMVAIGFKSNSKLAELSGIKVGKSGAIVTDSWMRTSQPDIFAAGDAVEVKNMFFAQRAPVYLASIARETGYIAAANAAGQRTQFDGTVSPISVRIFDHYFGSTGLTEEQAKQMGFVTKSAFGKAKNLVHIMPDASDIAGKLIINSLDKRIIGAAFLGGKEVSGLVDIISLSIKSKMTYMQLAEMEFTYTPSLSPFNHLIPKLIRTLDK